MNHVTLQAERNSASDLLEAPIAGGLVVAAVAPGELADAKLTELAADYVSAEVEIHRLEVAGRHADEIYEPLDQRRFDAIEASAQIPARSLAGVEAKATLYFSHARVVRGRDEDCLDVLGKSFSRDLIGHAVVGTSPDAELIRLCDRLAAIEAERTAVYTKENEALQDAVSLATREEYDAIAVRLCEIGRPVTLAGAAAMARCANGSVDHGRDGVPSASQIGEWLALGACAWLAGSATPHARFIEDPEE